MAVAGESQLQVTLFRDIAEDRNLSMKIYADRLATAIAPYCGVRQVRPWSPGPGSGSPQSVVMDLLRYAARYGAYPIRCLHSCPQGILHIVDHTYAHLLVTLPPNRTIVTCHDLMLFKLAAGELPISAPLPQVGYRFFRFSTRLLSRAAAVIADSEATASDLVRYLGIPRKRIHVIYLGVDDSFHAPPDATARRMARAHFGFGEEPVLLHVGTSCFYKNVEGIIQALSLLEDDPSRPKPVFVKAGQQLLPSQRKLAAAVGVADRVREIGTVSTEDMPKLYWAADVLVFPSWWEGFGWPPLEAMACGTPVVCSHVGSLREVVGEASAISDPRDPGRIASAVKRVLSDGHFRDDLVSAGLSRAREFTWNRMAKQVLDVYRGIR